MLTIKQLFKQSKQYKRAINIKKTRKQSKLLAEKENQEEWYKLDNAGLIFPAIQQSSWNTVFRVSAYLFEKVNPTVLEQAVNEVIKRFPAFNVTLKRGLFWYYFQQINKHIEVTEEYTSPCKAIPLTKSKPLFRVLYFNKKISIEFFHSLTDGRSGLIFLNTILSKYFNLLGHKINLNNLPISYLDSPQPEEWEDAFDKHSDLKEKASRKEKKGYQLAGETNKNKQLKVISLIMNSNEIKIIAKNKYNCSIQEFLCGVVINALQTEQLSYNPKKTKPVKLSVACDLRKFFPTKTLRNFANVINFGTNEGDRELSLEQCIELAKQGMSLFTKDNFMKINNTNVADQKNIFIRLVPLFIKNWVMNLVYFQSSEKGFACPFSNLGIVNDGGEFNGLVDKYDFIVGSFKFNKFATTVITYNNKLNLTFSLKINSTSIVKQVTDILIKHGIDIYIESNINNK